MKKQKNKTGKVFLVGAGPGDAGLITLRGHRLIHEANVIVVDDLVNPLTFQSSPAKIIYVGKRGPGAPSGSLLRLPQAGINKLLIQLAQKNSRVVRLKGGDPLVFGRGGEEMEALRKAGVPYEVVPGVTSAIAGPAFAGIPISDRRWASTVTFLTGQESMDANNKASGVEWEKLSRQGTLVILMGVSQWPTIRKKLLSLKWPAGKPVAAVESATLGSQRFILTTLGESEKKFKQAKLVAPSIIVVGEVAGMGRKLGWVEKEKPLLGKKVVVTRAVHQNGGLISLLEEKGAHVIVVPAISIEFIPFGALSHSYDWVVFTSENGVRSFTEQAVYKKKMRVCAVGPHTAAVLKELGWPVHKMAREYNTDGVVQVLGNVKGKRILWPRVENAPRILSIALRNKGAVVDELEVYRNRPTQVPPSPIKELVISGVDALTFASSSAVENFLNFFSPAEINKVFNKALVVSIGPSTTATLQKNGVRKVLQANQATVPGLVDALIRVLR